MSTETPTQSVTVGQVVLALRRRYASVLVCMLLGAVLAGLYSFARPPTFSATAVVTLVSLPDSPLSTSTTTRAVNTATESQVARSTAIAEVAGKSLGSSESPDDLIKHVNVQSPLESQVLRISFDASSAGAAAKGANAFANAYLSYRSQLVKDQVRGIAGSLDRQISAYQKQQDQAQSQAVNGSGVVKAQASSNVQTLSLLLQQLRGQRSQLSNASTQAGQLVGTAEVPKASAGPSLPILIAAGLAVGLVGGMALALVRDRVDSRVRRRAQVEALVSLPVLAEIPLGRDPHGRPTPLQTDAYRRLAAILTASSAATSPLLLIAAGRQVRHDTAAKLSCAIAEQMGDTLLMCAPYALARNIATVQMGVWHVAAPRVESFGDETSLRHNRPLDEIGGAQMVIVDGTNVQHSSTPLVLTSMSKGVVISAVIGTTRLEEISEAVRELNSAGANVHGVILLRAPRSPLRRATFKSDADPAVMASQQGGGQRTSFPAEWVIPKGQQQPGARPGNGAGPGSGSNGRPSARPSGGSGRPGQSGQPDPSQLSPSKGRPAQQAPRASGSSSILPVDPESHPAPAGSSDEQPRRGPGPITRAITLLPSEGSPSNGSNGSNGSFNGDSGAMPHLKQLPPAREK